MNKLLFLSIISCLAISTIAVAASDEILEKAQIEHRSKNYDKCAGYYQELIDSGYADMIAFYNAACCMAMAGDNDQAFQYLNTAIDSGYKRCDWLVSDPELKPLNNDLRWPGLVSRCRKAYQAYLENINITLYLLFEDDQDDRANYSEGDDWSGIAYKDSLRRDAAAKMIDNGQLNVSDDYFHAGIIFHHGQDSTDYQIACWLAAKALELDSSSSDARWLVAVTKDRYLWSIGRPQWYGTHHHQVNGIWTIEPIDTSAVTDEDRKFFGVATLEEARGRIRKLNER